MDAAARHLDRERGLARAVEADEGSVESLLMRYRLVDADMVEVASPSREVVMEAVDAKRIEGVLRKTGDGLTEVVLEADGDALRAFFDGEGKSVFVDWERLQRVPTAGAVPATEARPGADDPR